MSIQADPSIVRDGLRSIIAQCQARCLTQTSKWASENLLGMVDDLTISSGDTSSMISLSNINAYQNPSSHNPSSGIFKSNDSKNDDDMVSQHEFNMILHAQALISNGEYQRCSHVLLNSASSTSATTSSKKIGSSLGLFLAYYAMYMSGERIKDQQLQEWIASDSPSSAMQPSPSSAPTSSTVPEKSSREQFKNPFLLDLYYQLSDLFNTSSQKMDGFLMYLYAIVTRDLKQQGGLPATQHQALQAITRSASLSSSSTSPSVLDLFIISLHMNPMNWSCWLELASYCIHEKLSTIPTYEQFLSYRLPAPYQLHSSSSTSFHQHKHAPVLYQIMYHFFQAHIANEQQHGHDAMLALDQLHPIFPNSNYLSTAYALAQYTLRDYDQAQDIFESVRMKDPYRLELIDTYSNILYVKEMKTELSHLAHVLIKINKYAPETCCVIGNFYSLKGHHEKAIKYFTRALRVNNHHIAAWTLMGHEYVELRNFACAVKCYHNACLFTSLDYRAWYGLGQCYEILHMFSYALYYYKKATAIRNHDSRMWCAVASCYQHMNYHRLAIQAYECAVKYDDHEGIATKELARLYRQQDNAEQAVRYYLHHWIALGYVTANDYHVTSLMIQNYISSSTMHDHQPKLDDAYVEAILYVGNYFYKKGYLSHAEEYASLLLDYVGPEGEEARALLREIRAMLTATPHRSNNQHDMMNLSSSIHHDDGSREGFLLSTPSHHDDEDAMMMMLNSSHRHHPNTSQLRAFSMSTSSISSPADRHHHIIAAGLSSDSLNLSQHHLHHDNQISISSPMNSSSNAMSIDIEDAYEEDGEC